MKGLDIYIMASAILYEGDNEDTNSKKYAVQFLNHLLYEALGAENSYRKRSGEEVLPAAPMLKGLEETVPYNDKLCRTALVYGLCWHFFENLQNNYQSEIYRGLFVNALEENTFGAWEDMPDAI